MTDLTMIGLGSMGGALAKAFLGAGHSLTVWNRTSSKAKPLIALGANNAGSVSDAVSASQTIVVCVDNYDVTKNVLIDDKIGNLLGGKILVQFSTGTPTEATDLEDCVNSFKGDYLDAAIMEYPENVGAENTQILLAGSETAYASCGSYLSCLGGDIRYLGPNCSASAALDMALLTCYLCDYVGAYHGSLICETHNINVDVLTSLLPERHPAREITQVVHMDKYNEPSATLSGWNEVLKTIQTHATENKINCEIPDFISDLLNRAIAAGYGEEDIAAIIKILRKNDVA
jgi:3-hydroxyisobutyrate dehydrogenase-like beta-hydroxyacid dehydrogenase